MFIVFEGTEGCGKTTQMQFLEEWLKSLGEKVKLTREPGGTLVGSQIRDILLSPSLKPSPITELFLYAADRAQHIEEVIQEQKINEWLLCDRYIYSTIAYQGYGRDIPLSQINTLTRIISEEAAGDIFPDLVFWLDIDPKVGLERKREWKFDRIEQEKIDFHNRVREGYEAIYEDNPPDLIYKINGELSKEEVHQRIREVVLRNWKKNKI